jgi:hypothetical protein
MIMPDYLTPRARARPERANQAWLMSCYLGGIGYFTLVFSAQQSDPTVHSPAITGQAIEINYTLFK